MKKLLEYVTSHFCLKPKSFGDSEKIKGDGIFPKSHAVLPKWLLIGIAIGAVFALVGCGATGPLYLPQDRVRVH